MCSKVVKALTIILLLITLFSPVFAQKYIISGKLRGFKNGTAVSLMDNEQETRIKQTVLKNGKFIFKGTLADGPQYLTVIFTENGKTYDCIVFAGAGNIAISGGKIDFPYDVRIQGPVEQRKFNKYQSSLRSYHVTLAQLTRLYLNAKNDSARNKAITANNAVANQYHAASKKALFANTNTYYAANQLYDYLPQLKIDSVKSTYDRFSIDIKNSIYGKRIATYIAVGDTLKVNDKMFDFEAMDQTGKKQKLTNFGDKYILLDFTSVHCEPCVASNDELRFLASKYRDKLNIVSFTYDNRVDWMQGIKDGKVTWISLNDGKGNYSSVPLKYGVQGYPTYLIIKPGGNIVEKWSGYEKLLAVTGQIENHLVKYLSAP